MHVHQKKKVYREKYELPLGWVRFEEKGKRKKQSQAAAHPRHKEEEEKDKTKQAQIEHAYEKLLD